MTPIKRYLLIVAAIPLLANGAFFMFGDALSRFLMARYVDRGDYLASLQNFRRNGCFLSRADRADTVIFGDSHAFAGFDFQMADEAGLGRMGSCAVPAFFLDSAPELMGKALKQNPQLKKAIFITSPRMFWDYKNKYKALNETNKFLEKFVPQGRFVYLLRTIIGHWTDGWAAMKKDAFARHAPKIENLDEQALSEVLHNSMETHPLIKGWQRIFREKTLMVNLPRRIQDVCGLFTRAGVSLSVVHAPESPFHETFYTEEDRKNYRTTLALFNQCVDRPIFLPSPQDLDLGNRYYVNRHFSDIDYGKFSRGNHISNPALFDPDHLNPAGAKIFTRAVLNLFNLPPKPR